MKKYILIFLLAMMAYSCYNTRQTLVFSPYTTGYVYDRNNLAPIENATITFIQEKGNDIKQSNVGMYSETNKEGLYHIEKVIVKAFYEELAYMALSRSITFVISKPGYISDTTTIMELKRRNIDKNNAILDTIWLNPIKNIDKHL